MRVVQIQGSIQHGRLLMCKIVEYIMVCVVEEGFINVLHGFSDITSSDEVTTLRATLSTITQPNIHLILL